MCLSRLYKVMRGGCWYNGLCYQCVVLLPGRVTSGGYWWLPVVIICGYCRHEFTELVNKELISSQSLVPQDYSNFNITILLVEGVMKHETNSTKYALFYVLICNGVTLLQHCRLHCNN